MGFLQVIHTVVLGLLELFLQLITVIHMEHYQCDMASVIQLGKWFDYL